VDVGLAHLEPKSDGLVLADGHSLRYQRPEIKINAVKNIGHN